MSLSHIQEQINKELERKELLEKHKYKVWQGKDGYWYTHFPDPNPDKKRKLKKRSTLEALENDIVEYWAKHETLPLKDVFKIWVDEKLRYGDIKRQTYDRYIADFQRYFANTDIQYRDIHDITENDLEDFIRITIKEKELTRKSYSNLRTLILGTFKKAKKLGYTNISISQFFGDLDLSRKVFKQVVKENGKEIFTRKESEMIEQYVYDNPDLLNLGILLVFYTGLRVGELCTLKQEDVSKDILRVRRTEIHYKDDDGNYVYEVQESAKTDAGNRDVVLTSKAQTILKRIRLMNPFNEYLFVQNGERYHVRSFGHRLHVICRDLNIPNRSMHKIRKTCATNLINSGVDESLITSQMGHTAIDCTKKYYYFDNTTLDEAKEQLERAIL